MSPGQLILSGQLRYLPSLAVSATATCLLQKWVLHHLQHNLSKITLAYTQFVQRFDCWGLEFLMLIPHFTLSTWYETRNYLRKGSTPTSSNFSYYSLGVFVLTTVFHTLGYGTVHLVLVLFFCGATLILLHSHASSICSVLLVLKTNMH